jgi:amidophosphoribosyltransferase
LFPCKYNLSTRSINELAARRAINSLEGRDTAEDVCEYVDISHPKYKKMVDWIAKDLGVTSLKYLSLEDMVAAIGLPKEKLCLYCWQGHCGQICSCAGDTAEKT